MGELTTGQSTNIINLLHGDEGTKNLPKPFEKEIFLFDTHIAGTTFIEGILELEPQFQLEEKLNFYREPDNPHDPQAILIKNNNGNKLGYVPKADNLIFSRLMDAGKLLYARISTKKINGKWLNITIKVYLQE